MKSTKNEFETQILDIDVQDITLKLRKLGVKEEPEYFQKRWVFDLNPCTAESTGEWIRLRQIGNKKPTITYKNKSGKGLLDTKELEIEVSDFESAAEILSKLNFQGRYYQENKRKRFEYKNIEFTLDTWPMIPTYLEIEGRTEEDVFKGLELLDIEGKESGHIGTIAIYKKHGIDLHSMKELKFK